GRVNTCPQPAELLFNASPGRHRRVLSRRPGSSVSSRASRSLEPDTPAHQSISDEGRGTGALHAPVAVDPWAGADDKRPDPHARGGTPVRPHLRGRLLLGGLGSEP